MIDFPSAIEYRLQKKRGTQPILIVEIDWEEGSTVAYSDTLYQNASPRLISAGTVDAIGNSNFGDQLSNQISIILDSTDASVETLFRSTDMHLRPVRLYLGFSDTTERALLFNGLINSQVVWGEEDRTLQFQVLNKLEDSLVGFAMEDGNFPLISEEDRGNNWPLPFGEVCHYRATRLTTTIKGFLEEGLGAVDPTLPTRICQIEKTTCPNVEVPALVSSVSGNAYQTVQTTTQVPDRNCLARKRNEGCVLKDLLARQQALAKSSFTVRGGEQFPQNRTIKVRIGQVSYTGVMSGDTFSVTNVFHPDVDKIAQCKNVRGPSIGYRYGIGDEEEANTCTRHGSNLSIGPVPGIDCLVGTSMGIGGNSYTNCGFNVGGRTQQQRIVGGSEDSWAYYDSMEEGRFIWAPAGTEVILQEYDDDLVYMVSLVPGTVTSVLAYRTYGDVQLLSEVPTDWYTVQNVDYGGYQAVELRFNRLPSTDSTGQWQDDIIVSFVSSVGPNPVDIIEWLVDTYTSFTVDSANFAAVKSSLTEFGSNFVVLERPSVLSLINEIAYQQRMAVRISNDIVSLVYLGEEPTSERTLTESDLVQGSFKILYTETEKLRTNHKITWKPQYEPNVSREEVEKSIDLRFNIPKYGTVTEETDWYTQNTFETVLKTSTFWLIRKSNTWQEVEFETTLRHLDVEILDCVTLNINQFPSNTKVVIQSKQYNSDTNTISWRAWTPIRAGESTAYQWAWPAAVAVGNRWPTSQTVDQQNIGDGSGLTVVPPVGHPLRLGYSTTDTKPVSTGDPFPSDVGFTAPTIVCEVPLGNEIIFAQAPTLDPLAKQSFQQDMGNKEAGNSGGASVSYQRESTPPCSEAGIGYCPPETAQVGDEPPPEQLPEDEDGLKPCKYFVRLNYITPSSIRNNTCTGPCKNEGDSGANSPGFACNGSFITVETVVNSYEAALNAIKNHEIQASFYNDNCAHEFGVTVPSVGTQVSSFSPNSGIIYYDSQPPADACPELTVDEAPPAVVTDPEADDGSEDPPGPDVSP